ncbi:phage gp6-like head-tail connector protein [Klebsiella pneumoniae]|uniref:phage gp6-like head-tail connector protein n=1 Tax=Klebsiella pneumoniae TaxID=573 RepID=UPI000DA84C66|nr:phage gp6-like head-tail connector protein [Klebsiella pneumoniae]MRJ50674.1 phage gp6-like head-tail connector protein [Klebsiella pneumoniae]PZE00955.1 phage gp6-like head-tail connector protein [Klebsiella pneumoniae]PZE06670.1 phage gp6-like head-tail connector protein [Klebsiella pneumoniae]
MNERELSLIRALGEEFSEALSELRESFRKSLGDHVKETEEKLAALTKEVSTLKDTTAPDFTAQLADAVASLPAPKIPELPDIGAMVSEAVAALPPAQDGKSVTPEDVRPLLQELVTAAVGEIPVPRDGKDYDPAVLKQAVEDAVAALPPAQDGKSVTPEDVRPLLQELVTAAVGEIPVPRDGKDYDPAVLKQAVDDAVAALPPAQDGKSVTPEDVRPLLQELVTAAVSEIPVPRDGKDYDPAVLKQAVDEAVAALPPAQDGRDALQLEIQPFIDEGKSYTRGSYATHNGGLWRAYEKTHGMRGWECIVDGVSDVDISMNGQRNFIVTVNRASGASEKKSFDIPTMVYRGVFKSGDEYLPGDTVTWGGSLWHCDEQTQDKPGETGSKGWTLAAKRGRDGRGKV